MKYAFFGTPRFAEIILDRLIKADMAPVALVCNPDRPTGRKKIVTAPPTKQRALQSDASFIDIIQPETIDENLTKRLSALEADFFIVAAYAKIIPQSVLSIPRLGTIGTHPSLLPKFRGASPIQSAILAGEKETGVSLYIMDAKMDHGPVIAQSTMPLEPLTTSYYALEEQLAAQSAELLIKTIPEFVQKKIKAEIQDESRATFTKKFTADDAHIDETDLATAQGGDAEKARTIVLKVNAWNPEPGAWTMIDGKRTKILRATVDGGRLVITESRS